MDEIGVFIVPLLPPKSGLKYISTMLQCWICMQVFNKMSKQNVRSWNAMIVGYTQNGNCTKTLKLFYQMQVARVKLDLITWSAMMSRCAHNGYVDETFQIIQKM